MNDPHSSSKQLLITFLEERDQDGLGPPSFREIGERLGFRSTNAVSELLLNLENAGLISRDPKRARSIRLVHPPEKGIPLLGAVSAGYPNGADPSAEGLLAINPTLFGIPTPSRAFALRVVGDSMIGRHLEPGDLVILDRDARPRHRDIVAALIDQETTLKTLIVSGGRTFLRAENPAYPDLLPADELIIQGVAKGVIRNIAA